MRRLATRLDRVTQSPTLAMKGKAERLKREGRAVVDLSVGEPDFDTPQPVTASAVDALQRGFTHYTPANGIIELRQAIAARYCSETGARIDPDEVLVAPGGKSLLFAAAMALLSPGDEVAIFAPYWVSFPDQVGLAGGSSRFVPTDPADGFTPRAAALAAAIGPQTRAVILNFPNNPTGSTLPRAEAEAIVRLAIERDLWVISDETYELFVYDQADRLSMLEWRDRLGERLIFVSSFSKTFAMTGWRVGYAIAARRVTSAMLTIQSHDTTQAASFCQAAAVTAMGEAFGAAEQMRQSYSRRRSRALELLSQIPGIRCVAPRGAFYLFPDIREAITGRGCASSAEFCERLLEEQAVATIPGEAFGMPGFLRLSYATSESELESGLSRMARFVSASAVAP